MSNGLFITLEGIEGAGKSTQMETIADWFRNRDRQVTLSREPGGTDTGEAIRDLLLGRDNGALADDTELLLIFAARAQHIAQVIHPALADGRVVICDRFTDASYAYQGGGRGIAIARIAELEAWVQQGLKPDLTILLDLPIATGLQRAGDRSAADRFEMEDQHFFAAVRNVYLDIARAEPERVCIVDAGGEVSSVTTAIEHLLQDRFA